MKSYITFLHSHKGKLKTNKKTLLLYCLMIMDFITTYIGISIGYIIESNPLMVNLFNVPFIIGLLFRLIHIGILHLCLQYINYKKHPAYNKVTMFALVLNVIIMILHFRWIVSYIIFVR